MKPTLPERNVNTNENTYEPITPSPTTPTRSSDNYINISQGSTILEHDVNFTSDEFADFIQVKNQRTKSKNKQRKRRKMQEDGHVTTERSYATRSRGATMGHRWKCHLQNEV